MELLRLSTFRALHDWYVASNSGPLLVRYSWTQVLPPVTYFTFHIDDQEVYRGVRELISSAIFERNVDRFKWNGQQFTREGPDLRVDGVRAVNTSHPGSEKTVWYLALEDGTHIIEFSRLNSWGSMLGGAFLGIPGMLVGEIMDRVYGLATRYTVPAPVPTRVWVDGNLMHKQSLPPAEEEICRFSRFHHTFSLKWDRNQNPVLVVDETRFASASPTHGTHALQSTAVNAQVRDEIEAEESEIVDVEHYRLDNRHGSEVLASTRAMSKTTSTEVVVDSTVEIAAQVDLDLPQLIRFVKADLAGKLAVRSGQKASEELKDSQSITMSAAPYTCVIYTLTWKRKVRKGSYIFNIHGKEIRIPYIAYLDTTPQVESNQLSEPTT